jgi:hypothetical protein
MAMELLIRAARNDHTLIEKLCAPASAGLWSAPRLPMTAVVADATVAAERDQLRKTTTASGIPYLIDPVTPLLQDEQAGDHPWARLPFASPDRHGPESLNTAVVQDKLVEETLDFQRELGATMLIPPYLYSAKHGDGFFEINLQLLRRSAQYLARNGIDLPVVPVFAASLLEYGPQSSWAEGIDRFLGVADMLNLRFVALSWSASDPGKESYAKLAHLLAGTRHAAAGRPVIGWRQGLYGLALSAVGATGYETGAAQSERCHYPNFARSRRPSVRPDEEKSGGGGANVYFSTFGRSLPRSVGKALLADAKLRGSLVCTDAGCCPDGAKSMTQDWRDHAVHSRSRELRQLGQMPPSLPWRLNSIARAAERSATDARLANTVLGAAGVTQQLPEKTFRSLARVADELRTQVAHRAA